MKKAREQWNRYTFTRDEVRRALVGLLAETGDYFCDDNAATWDMTEDGGLEVHGFVGSEDVE